MNQRVYDECLQHVIFPADPHIWSVADIGEPDKISYSKSEEQRYREETYMEIVENVDRLISGIFAAGLLGMRRSGRRPSRAADGRFFRFSISSQNWRRY